MQRVRAFAAAVVCVMSTALLVPTSAPAQVRFGFRGGAYSNHPDPFVGVDAILPLAQRLRFDPNVEMVFGDSADDLAVSADFLYDVERLADTAAWIGLGPTVIFHDPKPSTLDNETRLGLDLIAGAALSKTAWYTPYVQVKLVLANRTRLAFVFGLRL